MRFSLRQIEIFLAIAHTQNVSRAAEHLAMSQSAASNALVELERSYDCRLFERSGKSLRLNRQGEALRPLAEQLVAQARALAEALSAGAAGPLRLVATLTIGNYLAPHLMAAYLGQFADAELRLELANTADALLRLRNGECDLALIEGDVCDPALVVEPWLADTLVLVCASQHPLAGCTLRHPAELSDYPWVVREAGSGTRAQFDREIGQHLAPYRLRLEISHTEALKRAVMADLGLGCVSRLTVQDELAAGRLAEIGVAGLALQRRFHLVWPCGQATLQARERMLTVCRGWSVAV